MKIVFITFSCTGNTQLVAEKIGEKLSGLNNTIQHFSAITIIKENNLGNKIFTSESQASSSLIELREKISEADVVATGAFANYGYPNLGMSELFSSAVLPSNLFQNMKFFFSYATAGQRNWKTCDVLSTLLSVKNQSAKYLGTIAVITPENFPYLQPLKPFRDAWNPKETERLEHWATDIANIISGNSPVPSVTFKPTISKFLVETKTKRIKSNTPHCIKEKCQKCGQCVEMCPYNALSMDIEDGFPVCDISKCEACARCFNTCPKNALEIPLAHTSLRSQYPKPNLVPYGEKCEDGMISQAYPQGLALNKRILIGQQKLIISVLCGIFLLIFLLRKIF